MFAKICLRTSSGLIQLGSFDRIGKVTKESYAGQSGEPPFADCQFVVMGYYPHYARLAVTPGATVPFQSRGTPWDGMFGDPLFGVPHDAAFQTFLQMLSEAVQAAQSRPVTLTVTELERNVLAEPIGRQERPIVIGTPGTLEVTPDEASERLRQVEAMQGRSRDAIPAAAVDVQSFNELQRTYYEQLQARSTRRTASDIEALRRFVDGRAAASRPALLHPAGDEYYRFAGLTINGPNRNGDVFSGPPTEIYAARRAGSNQLEILSRSSRDGSVAAAPLGNGGAVAQLSGHAAVVLSEFTTARAYGPGDTIGYPDGGNAGHAPAAANPAAGENTG